MTQYAIYFNQQWVGDHPAESASRPAWSPARRSSVTWRRPGSWSSPAGSRRTWPTPSAPTPRAGPSSITDGPYTETTEYLGGITVIDVPDLETAKMWAGRVAEGCGWPQEVRVIK